MCMRSSCSYVLVSVAKCGTCRNRRCPSLDRYHMCLYQSSVFFIVTLDLFFFFFQAEDGIRDDLVTGVQTCALPIYGSMTRCSASRSVTPSASWSRKGGPTRCEPFTRASASTPSGIIFETPMRATPVDRKSVV